VTRSRALVPAIVCLVLAACAPAAMGAPTFHPRVKNALGLIPKIGGPDIAAGLQTPVTYHGGTVMTGGVRIHAIFWAPVGYRFSGSPGAGAKGYEDLLKQFFTDIAHDSGGTAASTCDSPASPCNAFTVLPQFGQGTTPSNLVAGSYSISYSAATDTIDDTQPYPSSGHCASPSGIRTCLTDPQVQAEVDRLIQSIHGPRGLHDLWYVLLPPNVDECISAGVCGSNAFAGYHSLSNPGGQGVTIYAVGIDPLIETTSKQGGDPQGNPDAENAVDVAAHEVVEAVTDPQGVGWMDPNGFEVGDKCESGPQHGTPLGFAANGSPYNQLINGNSYLLQSMWSNNDNGCVQSTSDTSSPLPLPQVNMTQFSSTVSGNIARNTPGVSVVVRLQRAAPDGSTVTVAAGRTTTAANGTWSVSVAPHAVGDDRDQVTVAYVGAGAPSPSYQVIQTGNGGNPFTESGWTGWFDLDNGFTVTNDPSAGGPSVTLGPCFQTGVLGVTFNGTRLASPTDFCSTQAGTATVDTPTIAPGSVLTASSNDNRAFQDPNGANPNPNGGLVALTVPLGEADAVSTFANPLGTFSPSGFPTCSADLQAQAVACSGLVPGRRYTLGDSRSGRRVARTADSTGSLTAPFPVRSLKGGDLIALSNGTRTLSTLHVARLKASIVGQQSVLAGGTCQAGQYYGAPLPGAPTSSAAGGPGVALTGEICPLNGRAAGLSAAAIAQTDESSGGLTQTEVPDIENTSPSQGAIVYGAFTALAQSGLPGPDNSIVATDKTSRIALRITRASGGRTVFRAANVDTTRGVLVKALKAGSYKATWTLSDANGDTRTVTTRFVERPGAALKGRRRV
jgi:hypothetical protein